jgi:chitinase
MKKTIRNCLLVGLFLALIFMVSCKKPTEKTPTPDPNPVVDPTPTPDPDPTPTPDPDPTPTPDPDPTPTPDPDPTPTPDPDPTPTPDPDPEPEPDPEPDYSFLLDQYVGDVVNQDLELPDREGDLKLTWTTSDLFTINDDGRIVQGREDTLVTVYMLVVDETGTGYKYQKEVSVEAISFPDMRTQRIISGYLYYSSYKGYTTAQKGGLDVVNIAFGDVSSDFTVDVNKLKSRLPGLLSIRKNGVRVVLSLKNTSQNFSDAAYTEEGRKTLANSIVETLTKYHFDGIDIDWEFPAYLTTHGDADINNYTLLMKEIYETVKEANPDYLVTSATRGGSECRKNYDLGAASEYVDFYNVMTYDLYSSSKVYHHTAVYTNTGKATMTYGSLDGTHELYQIAKVDESKMVAGIAFYGYEVSTSVKDPASVLGSNATSAYSSITYKMIKRNYLDAMENNAYITYHYDTTCKAPYLFNSLTGKFVTYDNELSIKEKVRYVNQNHMAGVMIWELTYDNETEDMLMMVMDAMSRDISE